VCYQWGHFAGKGEGYSDSASALVSPKNFGFFEIYGLSARTSEERGLSQCGHFSDKEEGSVFRDLVWTSFMDNPSVLLKIKNLSLVEYIHAL